jgi:hypothetical protein
MPLYFWGIFSFPGSDPSSEHPSDSVDFLFEDDIERSIDYIGLMSESDEYPEYIERSTHIADDTDFVTLSDMLTRYDEFYDTQTLSLDLLPEVVSFYFWYIYSFCDEFFVEIIALLEYGEIGVIVHIFLWKNWI